MSLENMFQKKLIKEITKTIKENCADGGICKREAIHDMLAEKFDLPGGEFQDAVLKAAVEAGTFGPYANFKGGRGGCAAGIRELDVEAMRAAEDVAEKRRSNAAKAREIRAQKLAEKAEHEKTVAENRRKAAEKARKALAAKRSAEKSVEVSVVSSESEAAVA